MDARREEILEKLKDLESKRSALTDEIHDLRMQIKDKDDSEKLKVLRSTVGKCYSFSFANIPAEIKRQVQYGQSNIEEGLFYVIDLVPNSLSNAQCLLVKENSISVKAMCLFAPINRRLMLNMRDINDMAINYCVEISEERFMKKFTEVSNRMRKCVVSDSE